MSRSGTGTRSGRPPTNTTPSTGADGGDSSLDYRTLTLLNRLASERRALLSRTERLFNSRENANGGSTKPARPPSAASKLNRLSNGRSGDRKVSLPGANGSHSRPSSARPADRPSMGSRPSSANIPKNFSLMDRRPQTAAATNPGSSAAGIDLQGKSLNIAKRRGSASAGQSNRDSGDRLSARQSSKRGPSNYPVGPLVITESDTPGIPLVYRSEADREGNPERLNLDRRKLAHCPIVDGEGSLRLLNFQNNAISRISNMDYVPNLIFLDLYNNQITELCNLEPLVSLRVLMLGKNKISRIENLSCLPMLDVLDLHSNRLSIIENLDDLTELRVLNLAGNMISNVDNLSSLTCLTELNLRRNKIESVKSIEKLANLQRLFLSNNQIKTFSAVQSLFECLALTELALDGNPVASGGFYRQYVLEHIKSLRHLDLKRITEEERKISAILGQSDMDQVASRVDKALDTDPRESSIDRAQQSIEASLGTDPGTLYAATRGTTDNAGGGASASARRARTARPDRGKKGDNSTAETTPTSSRNIRPASAGRIRPQSLHESGGSGTNSGRSQATNGAEEAEAKFFRGNKGFMELDQSDGRLCIYGNNTEGIDRYSSVDRVLIKFMSFPKLLTAIPKLKKFARLTSLTLSNNNIETVAQLSHLGMLSNLRELEVLHNPVTECAHYRLFCVHRMATLRVLNGSPVTADESRRASDIFGSLHRLAMNRVTSVDPSAIPAMNKHITDFMYEQYAQRIAAVNSKLSHPGAPERYINGVVKDSVATHKTVSNLQRAWVKAIDAHVRGTLTALEDNIGNAMRQQLKGLSQNK